MIVTAATRGTEPGLQADLQTLFFKRHWSDRGFRQRQAFCPLGFSSVGMLWAVSLRKNHKKN
jgi:hypothetical protein